MAILSKINLKNTFTTIKEKINNFCAKPSQKRLAIIFTLTFALFSIPAYQAHAGLPDPIGWALGGISSIIQTALFAGPYILIWLFTGIAAVFVAIAAFLVNAALSPAIYMAIINSPGIDRGWTIMRDTANLFFILILIFIALATTLRLQSYSAKTWIPKLLFAAVFINFSKVITMFIIDIGNMFMYGAVSWMGQGIENTGIGKLTETAFKLFIDLEPLHKIIGGITLEVLVQGFLGFMFNLVLALTLLGFGILLLVRVSMLAILTIFSPIAFMLHAWPNAGKYAGQWWGSLLKYIVFGPIIVFFLFISSEMALTLFSMGSFGAPPTAQIGDNLSLFSFSGFFANLIPFVIVIIMLLSGLSFTAEMGIAGAGMIMGTVKGLAAGGGALVGYGATKSLIGAAQKGWRGAKGTFTSAKNKTLKQDFREKIQGKFLGVDPMTGKPIYERTAWQGVKGGLKNTAKGFGSSIKEGAYGSLKDTYAITKNKYSASKIKEEEDKSKLRNDSKDDLFRKLESGGKTAEDKAAYIHRLIDKGAVESLEDAERILKQLPAAKMANLDKDKVRNAIPEAAAVLKDKNRNDPAGKKEIDDHLSEMYDKGLHGKILAGGHSETVLKALEKIIPDPQELDNVIERKGIGARNIIATNLEKMVSDSVADMALRGKGSKAYDVLDDEGAENFWRASRILRTNKKDIASTFNGDKNAIGNYLQYNAKDIGQFKEKADKKTIADNVSSGSLEQLLKRDFTPGQRRETIINVLNSPRTDAAEIAKLKKFFKHELWLSSLKPESRPGAADNDQRYINMIP